MASVRRARDTGQVELVSDSRCGMDAITLRRIRGLSTLRSFSGVLRMLWSTMTQ